MYPCYVTLHIEKRGHMNIHTCVLTGYLQGTYGQVVVKEENGKRAAEMERVRFFYFNYFITLTLRNIVMFYILFTGPPQINKTRKHVEESQSEIYTLIIEFNSITYNSVIVLKKTRVEPMLREIL